MDHPTPQALIVMLAISALASGCASFSVPKEPTTDFLSRAVTRSEGDVTVSAAILSKDEAKQYFGTQLLGNEIQPIWIEVDNREDDEFWVMLLGIDPNYFSPSEAAWGSRRLFERRADVKMEYFLEKQLPIIIPADTKASGFVYTNFDPGAKAFTVELIGEKNVRNLDFVLDVPDFETEFLATDWNDRYADDEIVDLDLEGLRAYLEELPCCVLGGDRKTDGDPMNLVVVGESYQMLATFVRRGWDLTETVTAGTAWKTAMSSVFHSLYRTSPVSPLYVFDRPQDLALQKPRGSVDERNHLRLWLAPVTFQGTPVWVGQISRDIGVKMSSKTFVTHKIDPVVDEARLFVLFDLFASGYLERGGFVKGVGFAAPDEPRYNFTRDPYFTDGFRVALFIGGEPVGRDEIDWLSWEKLEVDRYVTPPPDSDGLEEEGERQPDA